MVTEFKGLQNRLVSQGHEVHIVYQTSGNIAVSNQEALKFAEIGLEINPESEHYKKIRLNSVINSFYNLIKLPLTLVNGNKFRQLQALAKNYN